MNLKDIKLAIIGLGYVGLPLAVEFGKKRSVIGFDINQKRINELKEGSDHTLETKPSGNKRLKSFMNKIIASILNAN